MCRINWNRYLDPELAIKSRVKDQDSLSPPREAQSADNDSCFIETESGLFVQVQIVERLDSRSMRGL